MHTQLILSLLQLDLLCSLDPISLISSRQPHLEHTRLVLDIRAHILLVVGYIVLPDIEVSTSGISHNYSHFGVILLLMSQFLSCVSIIGLYAVDNKSTKNQTLIKGQLSNEFRLSIVSDFQSTFFDIQYSVSLIDAQVANASSFHLLLCNTLKSNNVTTLNR